MASLHLHNATCGVAPAPILQPAFSLSEMRAKLGSCGAHEETLVVIMLRDYHAGGCRALTSAFLQAAIPLERHRSQVLFAQVACKEGCHFPHSPFCRLRVTRAALDLPLAILMLPAHPTDAAITEAVLRVANYTSTRALLPTAMVSNDVAAEGTTNAPSGAAGEGAQIMRHPPSIISTDEPGGFMPATPLRRATKETWWEVARQVPRRAVAQPFPLIQTFDTLDKLWRRVADGHLLLLLLSAPWCEACDALKEEMRMAAALLALRHRTVRLGTTNVMSANGAAVCASLCRPVITTFELPVLVIISNSVAWQYKGQIAATTLVRRMSLWATGQESLRIDPHDYHVIGEVGPSDMRERARCDPNGSSLIALDVSNLNAALVPPSRSSIALALFVFYRAASSQGARGASGLQSASRSAAALLKYRHLGGGVYKMQGDSISTLNLDVDGARADVADNRQHASSHKARRTWSMHASGTCGDSFISSTFSKSNLDITGLQTALSSSPLSTVADDRRTTPMNSHALPRRFLLRHGHVRVHEWLPRVQHAFDFVDVFSRFTHGEGSFCALQTSPQAKATSSATAPTLVPAAAETTTVHMGQVVTDELLLLDAHNFTQYAARAPFLLVTFITRWCARCIELAQQLHRAVMLLRALMPALPTTCAVVDMSDPINVDWLLEKGAVWSFPVGQLYADGVFAGAYVGGGTASNVVQELMGKAEELRSSKAHHTWTPQEGRSQPAMRAPGWPRTRPR